MRSYEQSIACEPAGDRPFRFVWRARIWRVESIERSWVETVPWWLGIHGGPPGSAVRTATRLVQRRLWRVEASSGERRGVYDLACCEDAWALVAAVD
ncbi:MAG: DUF6504 family protein [Propionibacterium sp.]